ncbi:MAG: hypothetical protein V1747_05600 [Candidatus Omnitrophota bacterium]
MKRMLILAMVCFFICINSAYAANWTVEVVSKQDVYELGQKAVFTVQVKKNRIWVRDKQIMLKATFPDSNTSVTLEHFILGRYRFSASLISLLEQQTFHVTVFQKNKPNKILAEAAKTITVVVVNDNSFSIKEGDFVNNNEVTLLINSNTNYELLISEDPLFSNALWMPYSPEIPYILSSSDGKKTIYLKFRHKLSQQEQVESKQITLDTMPPQLTIMSPVQGNIVTGRTN